MFNSITKADPDTCRENLLTAFNRLREARGHRPFGSPRAPVTTVSSDVSALSPAEPEIIS